MRISDWSSDVCSSDLRPILSTFALFFVILGLGLIGWLSARARAMAFRRGGVRRFSALPGHYGWYVALWAVIPALVFLLVSASVSPALVTDQVLPVPAAQALPQFDFARASILSPPPHTPRSSLALLFPPTSPS